MKKRAMAAILWFFAGWYGGALIAMLLGISPYFGPVLGTVAAAVVAGDPFHLIWAKPTDEPAASVSSPAAGATATEAVQTTN